MTNHGCLISQVDIGSDPMKFQTIRSKHLLHLFNLQDPSPEFLSGGIAQSGERLPCKQEVAGSIPTVSTMQVTSL